MEERKEMTLEEYQELSDKLLANLSSKNPLYPSGWWAFCLERFLEKKKILDITEWLATETDNKITITEYGKMSGKLLANLSSKDPLYPSGWWAACFKMFLEQKDPWDMKEWPTWKKISYGGWSRKELKHECKRRGIDDQIVLHVLNNLNTTTKEKHANLLVSSVEMIGFDKPATITEINDKLVKDGFAILMPEQIMRLDFNDSFSIAMEPVCMADGQEFMLSISNGKLVSIPKKAQLSLNVDVVFCK